MSTTIDSLEIQISASANKANASINTLVKNLNKMQTSLANASGKVNVFGKIAPRNFSKLNNSMQTTTKHAKSLASAFGKFYASYFLVIRGMKKLWGSIEGTADYLEAYNYFTVTFNKIAKEWNKDFEKFGYENADAYSKSFVDRMNKNLEKLSGVQLKDGLLSDTGLKNLGLNIQEVTQYASQLASVTNSVGLTGEASLATATSFTRLAGDISSLFNVDYSTVANNLQSGLIGQSRALYKYGIDITNATLQTYAYKLGLSKAVSEMTQAEKMQLRLVAILDQSKVSWGDLANTINSPSNMLRQFKNNLKEVGIVLGQLFVPLLQKVMPVINGITIAIKRLIGNIASLLGIKLDLDAFGKGGYSASDGFEDLSDSLDGVTNSAKKAKAGLRGFDELKVINTPSASGGASGGGVGGIDLTDEILKATEEYEKVWNEAFAKMENKALEFADKFEKILTPLKNLFSNLFSGNFFEAGQNVSEIAVGIFDTLSNAIESVDWQQVGRNIGEFFNGIDWTSIFNSVGNFLETMIDSAVDLLKGTFEADPIAGIIAAGITSWFLLNKVGINPTITISGITFVLGFDLGKEIGKALFPEDAKYYDEFTWFGEGGFFETLFSIDKTDLDLWIKDLKNYLTEKFTGMLSDFVKDVYEWLKKSPFFKLYEMIFGPIEFDTDHLLYEKGFLGERGSGGKRRIELGVDIETSKKQAQRNINNTIDDINKTNNTKPLRAGVTNNAKEDADKIYQETQNNFSENSLLIETKSTTTGNSIYAGIQSEFSLNNLHTGITSDTSGETLNQLAQSEFIRNNLHTGIVSDISGETLNQTIQSGFQKFNLSTGITIPSASKIFEKLKDDWRRVTTGGLGVSLSFALQKATTTIKPYASGGYPNMNSLSLVGENGPELIGKMNGKTAIAPNASITAGIEEAAYRGMTRALANSESGTTVNVSLEGDAGDLFRVVRKQADEYFRRSGNPAFGF